MYKAKLSSIADYVSDKVPMASLNKANYIGVDNMMPNYKGITQADYLPNEGNATRFMPGDILLGNIRPYFKKIWLATFEGGCSPDVLVIRPTKEVTPEYLYAALATDHFFAFNMSGAKGSKMPRGDKSHIMSYPVPLFAAQERIGVFVKRINTKIENNNAICAELEAMAKLLYDYWFVQFDFPDENGKPYKSSGGKMVWSEELKREIPEGWEVKSLFDSADVSYGFPLSTDMFSGSASTPVVRIRDILENSVSAFTSECVQDKYFTKEKDLLIGMDGNFHMNFWHRDGDCVNQRIFRIRDNGKASCLQIYFEIMPHIKKKEQTVARSTVGHLSDKDLKELRILISGNETVHSVFNTVLEKICSSKKENRQLASLRDFLLPLLMNGQVGFKEVDCH